MKRRVIFSLLMPLSIIFGFIPYVPSDTLLKLYPLPHGGLHISASSCTLNILQDTIRIAIGNTDSITWTAARVCADEIKKNFFYAIDPVLGPIKAIKIEHRTSLPNDTVVIAIGKRTIH